MWQRIKKPVAAFIALIGSFAGGVFFADKQGFHIRYVLYRFHDFAPYTLTVEGLLIAANYDPGQAFQFYHIRCNHQRKACIIIDGPVSDFSGGRGLIMRLNENVPDVVSYEESRIVLRLSYSCRREDWVLDRISKTAWMESIPLPLKEQTGDCSRLGNDIRKAFIGETNDLKM